MNKIWIKYLSKEYLKTFIFFTFCFYLFYTVIDYSSNIKSFFNASIPIKDFLIFYVFQISKRADILIPLSAMLATIRVLTKLNMNNELVAFQVGGFSLQKILAPFVVIGLIISTLLALNFELLIPHATESIQNFESLYFNKIDTKALRPIHQIILADNSKLIYQNYEAQNKRFYDSFWMKNNNEIYSIKYLYPHQKTPVGIEVNKISKQKPNGKTLSASYENFIFQDMKFNMQNFKDTVIPYENRPISSLWENSHILSKNNEYNEHQAAVLSHLFFKLCISFTTTLAILGVAAACIKFNRHMRVFIIYSVSIFSFLAFFTLLDAGLVLSENMILHPILTIATPTMLITAILFYRAFKVSSIS